MENISPLLNRRRGKVTLPRDMHVGKGETCGHFATYYIQDGYNKVLMHSTGNYIQYPVTNNNGKEYKKECIYV